MQERMKNPALSVPGAMQALIDLSKAAQHGIPAGLRDLINLRASQINGCSVCVAGHARDLKAAGESDERIFAVAAWRDAPYFTEAERAALALTEAATRLADTSDPVPDAIWHEAARHHDERALASIVLAIGSINVWNRLNVTTRQVAGQAW
ncbi:alkyl hydroperoxide reductase AhpD [Deinococcus aetherius]|uniref:Alkyl hydroperoxide reductase AhpD n=1 Tax=Deinococcus aetherius TaxID=200252 RepID=A0ABM8AEB0_9DEIO|nr:carboxymuconolactone decarboxylase family protein [Deinococcus aetherius]BDP42126.1 alkyl hydroperoxide reductase AhpD [Deinococcus aetherius]